MSSRLERDQRATFQTTKGTETDYPTLDCFWLGEGLGGHRWKKGVPVYKKQNEKPRRTKMVDNELDVTSWEYS